MAQVALSIDVEQDAPPFLDTWQGLEEGLPLMLEVLAKHDVSATFFVTGQSAEKFPGVIAGISQRHEVSCHGYEHERFDVLDVGEQRQRIEKATRILQEIAGAKPQGFRAPYFKVTSETLAILETIGYIYDSSKASYRRVRKRDHSNSSLIRIHNTLPSSFLRLPIWLSLPVLRSCLNLLPLVVLNCHPWELVRVSSVRLDMKFATGDKAVDRLDRIISYLRAKGASFITLREAALNRATQSW
ncbi:MAG: polysaccharide deacetylase family protein [Dehalococcoidia bacterium]